MQLNPQLFTQEGLYILHKKVAVSKYQVERLEPILPAESEASTKDQITN